MVQEAREKTGTKKSLDIFIDTGLPLKDKPLLVSQFSSRENDLELGKTIHDSNFGKCLCFAHLFVHIGSRSTVQKRISVKELFNSH